MDDQAAKNMSYKELRLSFRSFLFNRGKKENTVNAMTNDDYMVTLPTTR